MPGLYRTVSAISGSSSYPSRPENIRRQYFFGSCVAAWKKAKGIRDDIISCSRIVTNYLGHNSTRKLEIFFKSNASVIPRLSIIRIHQFGGKAIIDVPHHQGVLRLVFIHHLRYKTYLKWTLRTHTVTQMDSVTSIMVNSRYLPSNGTASEVGGIISASRRKNTVNESKIEAQRVTWAYKSCFINFRRHLPGLKHTVLVVYVPFRQSH